MARVDDFDAFYHATRRPLLHQAYALTGDLERAAGSVEHAFAQAWSQWRKVRRLPDPAGWVRHEAWRLTGGPRPRRLRGSRSGRRFVADPGTGPHAEHLAALAGLPDGQRRAVVLHHLAELPPERIARELGVSEASAASLLARGEQAWSDGDTPVATALHRLQDDVAGVRLTRAPSLRRSGERRYRRHTLLGMATAAALVAGGGLLIVDDTPADLEQASTSREASAPGASAAAAPAAGPAADPAADPAAEREPERPDAPQPFLLDQSALLSAREIGHLTQPVSDWSVASTTDGTTGNPIYAPCQREPFADPDGRQSLLRRYTTDGSRLTAVQVMEESRNETQSTRAFAAMEGWYARCNDEGVQLLSTQSVHGLGDEARAFVLRRFGNRDTLLTVGIVRTGPITSAVIASTRGPTPVPVARVLGRAGVSLTRVCLPVSGDCSTTPRVRVVPPLPALEHPGFVSEFDLPAIAGVSAPWVGTDPAPSPDNPASTPCERANFRRAQHPRTRVFVLPTAEHVPRRFGLSETVGTFATRADARRFVRQAYASAETCPERELSASKPHAHALPGGYDGRVWRFEFEVAESNSVFYRVALVRAGSRVALLSMSPSQAYDVDPLAFSRLAVRAGQRLTEARR
jgi:DNA-directed RNA polymerase specialized sigma24 family protein